RLQAAATREALALQATATRQALEVQATEAARTAAARATETARQVQATATAQALQATATAVARAQAAEERAAWWAAHVWAPLQALAAALALLGGLALAGWAAVRVLDALVLRIRVIRDPAGFPILVPEPDGRGRRMIFLPHRSPGPALVAAPPEAALPRVEAPAADPDATRRAQAVELVRAVGAGREGLEAARQIARTSAPAPIEIIDRPDPEVRRWVREVEAQALQELPA
ncbi:MAG: hypothetical protein RMM10_12670, partial [Anaerolineae bacterium]